MRTRGWFVLIALAATLLAPTAQAAKSVKEDRNFQLIPFGGWTVFDKGLTYASGQNLQDAAYFGGRASMKLGGIVWVEVAGGTSSTKPDVGGDDVTFNHFSGNLLFSGSTGQTLAPFLSVGGGGWQVNHKQMANDNQASFEVAAGVRLRLTQLLGLRLEARNVLAVPAGHIASASTNHPI